MFVLQLVGFGEASPRNINPIENLLDFGWEIYPDSCDAQRVKRCSAVDWGMLCHYISEQHRLFTHSCSREDDR